MTAPATTLLQSLRTHLAGITVANGFEVTVASVGTGRSALASDTAGPFPALTLTSMQDTADDTPSPQRFQKWLRQVMLEATLIESSAWDAELDTLLDAIRQRLTTWGGPIVDWGPVEFIPPGDGGGLCVLRMSLTIPYTLICSTET